MTNAEEYKSWHLLPASDLAQKNRLRLQLLSAESFIYSLSNPNELPTEAAI